MKQKMTAVDVRALVILLRRKLVGLRLANVYDVSGRLYLLKMSKANRKEFLLIESGIRIHTTDFLRNKKDVPSGFSVKLRKHLRTKKLENLTQLGVDRVIDLQFGKGENSYHILVELYAQGNVILTDHSYTILSLLRSHKFDETQKIQVKEKYPFTAAAGMTIDSIYIQPEEIKKFIEGEPEPVQQEQQAEDSNNNNNQGKKGKKPKPQDKRSKENNLKSVLTKMVPYINFPYAEHVLKQMGHDPNAKAMLEHSDILIQAARQCQKLVKDLEDQEDIKGYLVYQVKPVQEKKIPELQTQDIKTLQQEIGVEQMEVNEQDEKFKDKLLKDFGPIMLAQYASDPVLEYESFDQCVDEYFSQLDKQREQTRFSNKEEEIWKKMSRIKDDQEKRIQGLSKEQDLSEFKAYLLQKYIYETQAIIDILQVMQTSGISWNDIMRMVKEEKKAGNPLANLIYKIHFEKNQVSLLLDAVNEEDDVEERFTNFDPVMRVDVDLLISAQMNIKKYFEIKKKSHEKELKTKNAADVAVRDAEANALKELTKHRQTQKIDRMRKIFWFEKYDWFITSENYLIIAGKNAQQNEVLVKKYMNKGDLFMHTDMPGAAVTIIKNPSGQIVPPISLNEAAIFELCHSRAWEGKIVTSVYWVHADQVSKTPPTGLYITTGSFIIRGKRNFITPSKLELGFTLMFSLNEDSLANHIGERKPRLQQDELENQPEEELADIELDDDLESEGMLSKQSSTQPEEISVVQVGENKELMEQKRQQQFKKKQQQQQQKGSKQDKKQQKKKEEEEQAALELNQKQKQVRGKKQKLQKIKDKYADQDEEERQLKLELLGAKKTKGFDQNLNKKQSSIPKVSQTNSSQQQKEEEEVKENEEETNVLKEQETSQQQLQQQQQQQVIQQQQQQEQENQDEEEIIMTSNYQKEDMDEEEKREIEQLMKEEDINVVSEDVDINEIDKLTGLPKFNDIITGVVPMCAPYSAIQTYKFKVKIQPGTLKRGKAMKLIKSLFLAQANKNPLETSMIKNIPDPDITNMLVNNCRVLAPGLTKMQNANKQNKKKKT